VISKSKLSGTFMASSRSSQFLVVTITKAFTTNGLISSEENLVKGKKKTMNR
jgi:hypothetical protein